MYLVPHLFLHLFVKRALGIHIIDLLLLKQPWVDLRASRLFEPKTISHSQAHEARQRTCSATFSTPSLFHSASPSDSDSTSLSCSTSALSSTSCTV